MKHSVSELLELVGGSVEHKATVRAARAPAVRAPMLAAKRQAASRSNGNGHAHAAPAMASARDNKGAIPMEGDFTSF